ncbi:MAG: hypothetical protein BWX86_02959 [Verrucomicrobia bacterium ADurb.Bin122]|nr:MAG: hypothetical protein BWX86_02959 [Verrucomicrobia bacterium ADurb.Bin122]
MLGQERRPLAARPAQVAERQQRRRAGDTAAPLVGRAHVDQHGAAGLDLGGGLERGDARPAEEQWAQHHECDQSGDEQDE